MFNEGKLGINYDPTLFKDNHVGDIVVFEHNKYKITKKTTTAIALERYYWWDNFADWAGGKLGL